MAYFWGVTSNIRLMEKGATKEPAITSSTFDDPDHTIASGEQIDFDWEGNLDTTKKDLSSYGVDVPKC